MIGASRHAPLCRAIGDRPNCDSRKGEIPQGREYLCKARSFVDELLPFLAVSNPTPRAPIFLRAQSSDRTLKLRPWGGTSLWRTRGLKHPERGQPLGEVWEFSTLPGSESVCESQDLQTLLGHRLEFLAKLVDVARPLSVQVHPEGPAGKEEAWVVLDAAPDAYILAGLKPGIGAEDFKKAIAYAQSAQGRQDEVFDCMRAHPVHPGTMVIIPPRTVHTIPCRVQIAEIQDPNDVTYRFFDYGSDRPLHPSEAFDALDPQSQPKIWHPGPDLGRQHFAGAKVRLEMVGPGEHEFAWSKGERLFVSVQGACVLRSGQEQERLEAGELRLARCAPVKVEVPPNAMAVMAWLNDQART